MKYLALLAVLAVIAGIAIVTLHRPTVLPEAVPAASSMTAKTSEAVPDSATAQPALMINNNLAPTSTTPSAPAVIADTHTDQPGPSPAMAKADPLGNWSGGPKTDGVGNWTSTEAQYGGSPQHPLPTPSATGNWSATETQGAP